MSSVFPLSIKVLEILELKILKKLLSTELAISESSGLGVSNMQDFLYCMSKKYDHVFRGLASPPLL